MLLKQPGVPIPHCMLDEYIGSIEALLEGMRMLREHGRPTIEVLESAPLLDRWDVKPTLGLCLVGLSHGHPHLPGGGRPIATSELLALAPDEGWARTHSRFYRLGRRNGEPDHG